jgi:hypothetical protein
VLSFESHGTTLWFTIKQIYEIESSLMKMKRNKEREGKKMIRRGKL